MDDALDALDLVADLGLEGVAAWIVRLVGLLALLSGLGLWLLTDAGFLVLPAVLVGLGLVLLVAPTVLLVVAEFA